MKTILATVVALILLFVAAASALIYSGIYDVRASSPHGGLMTWVLETTRHNSVERSADEVQVPDLGDRSLVLAGVNDFEEMCVQCHGAPGREPAALGKGLNPLAPDLAESATELTAAELFWITKHGVRMTGMPAWGETHQDYALWPVVAFIAALPELDAAAYDELLKSAEGMGHHAGEAADGGDSHTDTTGEETPHTHDHGESTGTEEVTEPEPEHDHSDHEH